MPTMSVSPPTISTSQAFRLCNESRKSTRRFLQLSRLCATDEHFRRASASTIRPEVVIAQLAETPSLLVRCDYMAPRSYADRIGTHLNMTKGVSVQVGETERHRAWLRQLERMKAMTTRRRYAWQAVLLA